MTPTTLESPANGTLTARYPRTNAVPDRSEPCVPGARGATVVIRSRTSYNLEVPYFRVLGPLEATAADGTQIPLGGARQRAVLAALLLRVGKVVSTEFLIDAVWGEHAPRTAMTSLQNSISNLRRAVGAELLLTRPPGYVLAVEPQDVDLGRFERLVREARSLPPEERAAALRDALALWRGQPLADVLFEGLAGSEMHRLEDLQLAALESWADAELACGRAAEVVPELERLVREQPLREELHRQLMLALYHTGRQAEAANAYRNASGILVEQGLEPSPRLKETHKEILQQTVAHATPAQAGLGDDHFGEVADALAAGRLVPVLGTDVSELASRLARRFEYPPEEAPDLTRVAQYVSLTKGAGPLYEELRTMLEIGAEPTPVHRFFASLPPVLRLLGVSHQLLVTTSYDLALEQAFLEAEEEFDVVSYLASGRHRGRFCHVQPDGTAHVIDVPNTYASELSLERRTVILKLHGGINGSAVDDLESFVVTEDDYIDYLAQSDVGSAIPVALAAKLRRSHFLFLGYGMRDWNLRLVLGRIWGAEGVAYRSWAVQAAARPLERQFWRARDVDLIEMPLDDHVSALGRHLSLAAEAVA